MIRSLSIILILCTLSLACKQDSTSKKEAIQQPQEESLERFAQQLEKDSTNHGILYQRAQYYYANENYGGAIKDLILAINYDSLQVDYYHLMADACLDYYRSKEAVLTMERCIALFPDRIPSLLKLSEIYYILKQFEESLTVCGRIAALDPNEAEAQFMMGLNFRAMGDINKSINAFQTSTEINPDLVDAWIILGQIHEDKKDPLALDYFDAAINVNSNNISALHSKAFYLQNNNRMSEAIQIYRSISNIDKNYLDAYLNCGILYMNMDSLKMAKEQFEIMIGIKPQNSLAHFYKGEINSLEGNIEQAQQDYQNAVNLDSKNLKAKEALEKLISG